MAAKDCIDEIRRAAGRDLSDDDVLRIAEAVEGRRRARAAERAMDSQGEALAAAAEELGHEARAAAAIERRNALLNLEKRIARRQFYDAAPDLATGLEAKLVGVNRPFAASRLSVDAQAKAMKSELVNALDADLDRAGLFEAARHKELDRAWAREVFEISKGEAGAPGVTGSREALAIAEIVHRYQTLARERLNRAGAWIGEYRGYITRTSHDPDRIRRAGFDSWRAGVMEKLDAARTFEGVEDPERFLRGVYNSLVTGVHLTQEGLQGFKDPAFTGPGNLAKRLSQGRVLHFRDAESWVDYHQSFGRGTLMEGVLSTLDRAADQIALMREFGTNPRAEFEADLRFLAEGRRDSDPDAVIKLREKAGRFKAFFDQLDGTAQMPVNRLAARISSGWRAVQSISKLGGVLFSSFSDLPFAAAELRYQGHGLLGSYLNQIQGALEGRGTGDKRDLARLLRVGFESFTRDLSSRFTGTDTMPGRLSKLQNTFFRFTGLTYWTDAQKNAVVTMMAHDLAARRASGFADLPERTRRMLGTFGIDEGQWDMVRAADLVMADGRHYVTPDVANRVDEGTIVSYLRAGDRLAEDVSPALVARRVQDFRDDLGLRLSAYFTDRADFAVLTPGARERALMYGSSRPGELWGEAARMFLQFKAFPVAVVTKAWGREIYGGDAGAGRAAGIAHMIVASVVFGYLAQAAKDIAKGRSPRDPTDLKTWVSAFAQGGGAGIYGDFLFGEFNRFGQGAIATLAGPTAGEAESFFKIWQGAREGEPKMANALRFALRNTPFINLFYTRIALDYLVLYQIQEALSPGFLRRFERRVERENKQSFILSPADAIPHGGGRILEGVR